jgi:hypothetical protein
MRSEELIGHNVKLCIYPRKIVQYISHPLIDLHTLSKRHLNLLLLRKFLKISRARRSWGWIWGHRNWQFRIHTHFHVSIHSWIVRGYTSDIVSAEIRWRGGQCVNLGSPTITEASWSILIMSWSLPWSLSLGRNTSRKA